MDHLIDIVGRIYDLQVRIAIHCCYLILIVYPHSASFITIATFAATVTFLSSSSNSTDTLIIPVELILSICEEAPLTNYFIAVVIAADGLVKRDVFRTLHLDLTPLGVPFVNISI